MFNGIAIRTYRFAIAAAAIVGSTILIECGSDDNTPSDDSGVPAVSDSTLEVGSLPVAETLAPLETTAP
jgi:hypothetical protein